MKALLYTGFFITCIILAFSCSHGKDDKPVSTKIPANQHTEKKLSISLEGELNFRRTFANIQFMDDEKEISRYIEQQEKSNPVLISPLKEALRKRFEEQGIVKDKELLLHTFKKKMNTRFQFNDESGKKIHVLFKTEAPADQKPGITGTDSCEIKFRPFQDLRYALLDIIPGGNKEIVLLNEWYIMNGYNFDLMVYEICRK